MAALTEVSSTKCFDGYQKVFSHQSEELKCNMKFAVYLPPIIEKNKVPVFYWLSGLECTEQNFIQKSGAQRYAAEHGLMIVCPDTSPRGCNIEGEDDSWDFGTGAGFYVDATEPKWSKNYRMYSYVTRELPELIDANFRTIPGKKSISGHSMGGHGALICALKNPGMYCCVSAFAPICNPTECAWGQKALTGYLGTDREAWKKYDATHLIQEASVSLEHSILIDQGGADVFKEKGQLLPENFVSACAAKGVSVIYNKRPGYDHGYFFISTFIGDHIKHHATCLKK